MLGDSLRGGDEAEHQAQIDQHRAAPNDGPMEGKGLARRRETRCGLYKRSSQTTASQIVSSLISRRKVGPCSVCETAHN
jgi:hypothetical protein